MTTTNIPVLVRHDGGVFEAAVAYARNGIPVAPFDPGKGKGKSCWNLVPYEAVTTNVAQLHAWQQQFGPFEALATSPGQFNCVVLDVDSPPQFPKALRPYLDDDAVPFVATRPTTSPKRGHYWFALPAETGEAPTAPTLAGCALAALGNPVFGWGELRCHGGGIVLPPYGDRFVARQGTPPVLPVELIEALHLATHCVQAGAGGGGWAEFRRKHQESTRPHKLAALLRYHETILAGGGNMHDATRKALVTGLEEARIGYVPATDVVAALLHRWRQSGRPASEFRRLVAWAVAAVQDSNVEAIKLRSDRCPGTDSRIHTYEATIN